MAFKKRFHKRYYVKPKANLMRRHVNTHLIIPDKVFDKDDSGIYSNNTLTVARAWSQFTNTPISQCMISNLSAHITVKHPLKMSASGEEHLARYVTQAKAMFVYLPQGVEFRSPKKSNMKEESHIAGTIYEHPEWVMAEKYFAYDTTHVTQLTLTSKLKRNLMSADRIVLVIEYLFDNRVVSKFSGNVNFDIDIRFCSYIK